MGDVWTQVAGRPACRSAWWPGHRAAPKQVHVHMPDGLPAVLAGVEDEPVPGVVDALGHGDLARRADKLGKQPVTGRGELTHVREVVPRDYQDVGRRLGVDVTEGDDTLPLQHYRGGDLSGSDPAEQAVWHNSIIVAAGHLRCRTADQAVHGLRQLRLRLRGGYGGGRLPVIIRNAAYGIQLLTFQPVADAAST